MGDKKKKNIRQAAAIQLLRDQLTEDAQSSFNPDEAIPVFENTKAAVNYLQTRLIATGCTNASDAAEELLPELLSLPEESSHTLLLELLKHAALEGDLFPKKRADIFELSPDFMNGGYPYKNRYPSKLYEKELFDLQVELLKMQEHIKKTGQRMIIIFEGRDTAGKGGTIRRFVENLNPRGARIVALSKPSDVETGQWYFQRYVTQLPNPGEICFFDRSWYNRAVVEPVMGFCRPDQTELFLKEVSYFEQSLVNHDEYASSVRPILECNSEFLFRWISADYIAWPASFRIFSYASLLVRDVDLLAVEWTAILYLATLHAVFSGTFRCILLPEVFKIAE